MQYNITYRKKDGGWQYIISFKEGEKWRQKSKQGFRTRGLAKVAADERIEKMKEDHKLKKTLDSSLQDMTFEEFMNMYIEHKETHREYSTVRSIRYSWNKFSNLNDMAIKDITSLHTQNCVDEIVREGLSYNTIKSYVALMNGAFNYAIDKKIIKDNPMQGLIFPDDKSFEKIKALDKWEFEDLLSKVKNKRYRMIAMIAGTCGLRIGEIIGLTWDCIDFENSTMTVNKQWKEIERGKWGFGPVKRKNSNRTVPIPPKTLKELARYKSEIPTHISNRIFYQNVSIKNLGQNIATSFKEAGYDITVHELRHTYATLLIANGVDFKTVAKLMGHDVEQTLKTYSHVTDEMMNKATNTLKTIFK